MSLSTVVMLVNMPSITLAEGSTEITDTIKQKCSDKDCAGAEQLGWKGTNLPSRNHFVRNRRQEGKTEKEIAKF
jgi:hypothetical protein